MKLEFSQNILKKNIPVSNFMKMSPLGADLFHADRRTDGHDEADSCHSQSCERARKLSTRQTDR
jgi:hypothetical protein